MNIKVQMLDHLIKGLLKKNVIVIAPIAIVAAVGWTSVSAGVEICDKCGGTGVVTKAKPDIGPIGYDDYFRPDDTWPPKPPVPFKSPWRGHHGKFRTY